MAKIEDWIEEVARVIRAESGGPDNDALGVSEIQGIIEDHCPFKPNVLYMEVDENTKKLDKILEELAEMKKQFLSLKRSL